MQIKHPHSRFCRLDATRDELSPQAAERFDQFALFNQLCCMRACSRATATCASAFLDHLIRQAPFDIGPVQVDGGGESVAEFERFCNAYRPHQALEQTAPMQAV